MTTRIDYPRVKQSEMFANSFLLPLSSTISKYFDRHIFETANLELHSHIRSLVLRGKIKQLHKIKVGIVNYLNTKPLLFGLNHSPVKEQIELIEDYPANIAAMLLQQQIDIGLVPVAILPRLNEYYLHTNYCIGCDGAVGSVCLFSDLPIHEVETVLLDYQSKTSVALLKVLLRDFWKIHPQFIDTTEDYRSSIQGNTAGLVIGDRSFAQKKISKYAYDLGSAWKQFTSLPFVFAAWASAKPLDDQFIQSFNQANEAGLENLDAVVKSIPDSSIDARQYFTQNISYPFDSEKRKGLQKFLDLLSNG